MRYAVVFAADDNYIQHFCVCLKSLLVNNSDIPFEIYLLNKGISEQSNTYIQQIIKDHKASFKNIIIDDSIFSELHTGVEHLNIAAYYRLTIPKLIDAERVLYLDSDMVVTGSLKELFEIDFENNYVLAIEDTYTEYINQARPLLKMSADAKYFNSGVMVINTQKWLEDNLAQKCILFAKENPDKIPYADQDCLNAVIDTKWKTISYKYNVHNMPSFFTDKKSLNAYLLSEMEDSRIIHFTGGKEFKPWHYVCIIPQYKEYWKYLKMTPFKDYKPQPDYKGWIKYKCIIPLIPFMKKFKVTNWIYQKVKGVAKNIL